MQRIHIKNFDIDKSLELTEQTFLLQGQQKLQQKELRKHRKTPDKVKLIKHDKRRAIV